MCFCSAYPAHVLNKISAEFFPPCRSCSRRSSLQVNSVGSREDSFSPTFTGAGSPQSPGMALGISGDSSMYDSGKRQIRSCGLVSSLCHFLAQTVYWDRCTACETIILKWLSYNCLRTRFLGKLYKTGLCWCLNEMLDQMSYYDSSLLIVCRRKLRIPLSSSNKSPSHVSSDLLPTI